MEKVGDIFEFRQSVSILKSTGAKAGTLRELQDKIATISEESIYHHTYQYFRKGHAREYTNDFAHWAGESLEERALSERLSNIDPYTYADIDSLRKVILSVIDDHLERFPEPREAMRKDEFHFTQTVTLVFPTGTRATNLAEWRHIRLDRRECRVRLLSQRPGGSRRLSGLDRRYPVPS